MTPRTAAGLVRFRPVAHGSRIALVAPASPFDRAAFDKGVAELRRLGFDPVYDDDVFERRGFLAGTAETRARALERSLCRDDIRAVIAVRGGYGSVEVLPFLDPDRVQNARTAFVGYSDVTSIHSSLNCQFGMTSVHGPMIDGRLAVGPSAYDPISFLASLGSEALGELAPEALEVIRPGEAVGALYGGTLTQLLASWGTPWEFRPPTGHVLFVDEVAERPYRLHRMLTQMRLAGRLAEASAVVFGQLPRCDEPGGHPTAVGVVREVFEGFPGPVLCGFPSGHTTTPLVSLPLGVRTRVVGSMAPRVVIEEAAAGD